jgi:hypothetical protein
VISKTNQFNTELDKDVSQTKQAQDGVEDTNATGAALREVQLDTKRDDELGAVAAQSLGERGEEDFNGDVELRDGDLDNETYEDTDGLTKEK